MRLLLALLLCSSLSHAMPAHTASSDAENMNGDYFISPTPGATNRSAQLEFTKSFRNYPRGTNYFDVVSPKFSTLYSQVLFFFVLSI